MESKRFSEMQKDIPGNFLSPTAILSNSDLDAEQKCHLLKQWEFDLRQLMVASEENMTDQAAPIPGKSAELLRHVRKALSSLEEENPHLAESRDGPPAKAGGAIN
jgi:hypothetical protein